MIINALRCQDISHLGIITEGFVLFVLPARKGLRLCGTNKTYAHILGFVIACCRGHFAVYPRKANVFTRRSVNQDNVWRHGSRQTALLTGLKFLSSSTVAFRLF